MNKLHRITTLLLLGVICVGPGIHYAETIVVYGAGLVSHAALVTYAIDTLLYGSVEGFICASVCALVGFRLWRSAICSSLVILGIRLALIWIVAHREYIPAESFSSIAPQLVIMMGGAGLMGFTLSKIDQSQQKPDSQIPISA